MFQTKRKTCLRIDQSVFLGQAHPSRTNASLLSCTFTCYSWLPGREHGRAPEMTISPHGTLWCQGSVGYRVFFFLIPPK